MLDGAWGVHCAFHRLVTVSSTRLRLGFGSVFLWFGEVTTHCPGRIQKMFPPPILGSNTPMAHGTDYGTLRPKVDLYFGSSRGFG